jgi:hypothetical protein
MTVLAASITDSFSKAVEQLGSDKLEVRLGGIYTLERISKESEDDYWTVIDNLAAFVRERSQRNEAVRMQGLEQRVPQRAYFLWQDAGRPGGRDDEFWAAAIEEDELGEAPVSDVAAVLTAINRRSERNRNREVANAWSLDLRGAILKQADLRDAHLEGAFLWGAHLERANLRDAHLDGAYLTRTHLEGADLKDAHLEQADLWGAHLEGANLRGAHLEGADLRGAHLEGIDLSGAHLEGAILDNEA